MIENLETLIALSKTGTMMEASTSLRISQSAVSKRIAALERYYDRDLIERHLRVARHERAPKAAQSLRSRQHLLVLLRSLQCVAAGHPVG